MHLLRRYARIHGQRIRRWFSQGTLAGSIHDEKGVRMFDVAKANLSRSYQFMRICVNVPRRLCRSNRTSSCFFLIVPITAIPWDDKTPLNSSVCPLRPPPTHCQNHTSQTCLGTRSLKTRYRCRLKSGTGALDTTKPTPGVRGLGGTAIQERGFETRNNACFSAHTRTLSTTRAMKRRC